VHQDRSLAATRAGLSPKQISENSVRFPFVFSAMKMLDSDFLCVCFGREHRRHPETWIYRTGGTGRCSTLSTLLYFTLLYSTLLLLIQRPVHVPATTIPTRYCTPVYTCNARVPSLAQGEGSIAAESMSLFALLCTATSLPDSSRATR